jgi:predicted metal-dependent phosphoesterase TrpH
MTAFARTKARRHQRADDCRASGKGAYSGRLEGAQKLANGGAVTRGHFARFLVEAGNATTWRMSLKVSGARENRIRSATVVYNKTSY